MMKKISSIEEYKAEYKASTNNTADFWANVAEQFNWKEKWHKIKSGNFTDVNYKWFEGGRLNITENCLDRHLVENADKTAIIWESNEPGEASQHITYKELYSKVCNFANVLKSKGVVKGDRICLYMPMTPELAIAVLACARIGAIHSVVFGGFSAKALADRIDDASCKVLLTADGVMRGNKRINLYDIANEAMSLSSSIETCIVQQRTGHGITLTVGRDLWWHEEVLKVDDNCPAEIMDAEDPLFILYTSGSTGTPKGLQHACGGYMVYTAYSFKNVFQHEENDVYWCTADIGWITGHSYIVYGPLLNGATTLMFEGVPTYPDAGRFWNVVDKHQVKIFYTAPTAIRALQAFGTAIVDQYDLSSLRVLGSVGEPINEEAWHWYDKYIGKGKCPIVDTWWQTETGGILISPLAGITPLKPTYATLPLPGVEPVLVDSEGNIIEDNDVEGNLCIKGSWPSQARTIYGEHDRFIQTYFSTYPGLYFTGDGCKRDADGYYRITGRVDDVINVSGHRIGTAEVENAIDEHEGICETAVVGYPHDIKGQGIYAYVVGYDDVENEDQFRKEIIAIIIDQIGPIAKPDKIQFVSGLPKTRSGKIMRRILRKIAEGQPDQLGDISTLLDPSVVESIKVNAIV
jgi:acetyl-CoA synthetase